MSTQMPINGTARFIEKVQLSETIYEFTFEMINPAHLDFYAGQYIVLEVAPSEKRQYSISTSPLTSNTKFQTVIDFKPKGLGTKYLENLKRDDQIKLIGQIGRFVLPEELKSNLFFIATGSGLSPLKAMIETLILSGKYKDHKINLLFGSYKEAIYKNLFDKYVLEGKLHSYKIYFSGENITQENNVFKGWVTKGLEDLDPSFIKGSQFFLCGNLDMIRSSQEMLSQQGVSAEDIYHEKFY